MKLVTIGLFAVGVVAAASAAVLVASMEGAASATAAPTETTIVVAARDLQATTSVDATALETRTISVGLAPAGAFSDPVQCIGKMLTAPVHAGQALTADAFAADGSIARLAAALPAGRRAVSVSLGDPSAASLLYPGCVVDVLATMRLTRGSGAQRPVTVTLMQSVTVLAVGSQNIVSTAAAPATPAAPSGERPAVVLLVDSRQAEMLKLAMQEGSLSLVLRNPNDTDLALASGADMGALVPGSAEPAGALPLPASSDLDAAATLFEPQQQTWEATVLRGATRENRTFVLPASSKP
jgi:pilus assembly protein CpaB